jgi:hypothetical protein
VLLKAPEDHPVAAAVATVLVGARCRAHRSTLPAERSVHGRPGTGLWPVAALGSGSRLHRQLGWCGAPLMLRARELNGYQLTPDDASDRSGHRAGRPEPAMGTRGVGPGGGRFGGYRAVPQAGRRIGC